MALLLSLPGRRPPTPFSELRRHLRTPVPLAVCATPIPLEVAHRPISTTAPPPPATTTDPTAAPPPHAHTPLCTAAAPVAERRCRPAAMPPCELRNSMLPGHALRLCNHLAVSALPRRMLTRARPLEGLRARPAARAVRRGHRHRALRRLRRRRIWKNWPWGWKIILVSPGLLSSSASFAHTTSSPLLHLINFRSTSHQHHSTTFARVLFHCTTTITVQLPLFAAIDRVGGAGIRRKPR